MATTLVVGDLAIVHYNTSADAFSYVFLRDVEAGTTVNFTDNGWLASGGFRPGEGTVTYTAATATTAGTIVTLTGLDLDDAGDQIIAYQGDPASPTILHVIDFADGNNTVAGDATDDNTTALPPGFTLGVNAVAVAFDHSLYAGPISGSPAGLFSALNNSANWLDDNALPAPLIANAKPTIDLDSDNSTEPGIDYETTVASGGPGVPIADIDIAIDDDDGFFIFAAEMKVNGKDPRDLLTVNGSLPAGIVVTAYNPATGILRLEGQASHAAYEAAIRQVEFSTTDNPNQLKRVLVSVYDGVAWSKDGTAFIHVSATLPTAPPVLDLDANNSSADGADASATYTAGGLAKSATDIDVTITDADSTTIQSATITILGWARNLGDLLSVDGSLPGGITASTYSEITGVLTLSGPASLADYQTALHQVVYSNTLAAPSTADRGIQVTVNDGTLSSNAATMYMHVVVPPPNVAPVFDLDANNSTTPGTNYLTGFTEGGPPVAIADADVSIFDPDSPSLASATITLTNPQTDDVLTFEGTPPLGIVVSGSGTSVVTLTGAASSASYQAALQQITFSNGNIDPSNLTRVIEVVVNDGISNSNTATAIVQVEAVNNSAPVIDLDPNDSSFSTRTTFRTAFTENGTPVPIADTDTTITDLDSTTLVSATITLANQHPGDLLTVPLPLPGGIVASSYDPGTGVLTLTGAATLDAYEAALQQVLYRNIGDNPATDDRLIEVVVNDGVNTSNVADAVISVVAVNDAPVIQIDTVVTYIENAAPIALSPLAILIDADDTELNDLTVRITGGAIPGDGDTLTVGGSTSGTINGITFLWHPAEHAMVFTGASLVANYQDLLRTVEFHSTSDNPTDFNASSARTLTWSLSGGTAVTTVTTTLDIVAMNDAPQAAVASTASYTENGAPVVISPASIVTDVDDINLIAGEVRIVAGAVDGDLLTVNGLQSGTFSGIDFSYNAVQHSLTFTHPTTVADYQAFLQAIEFSSTSDNPTDSGFDPTRTLSWFVFDGDALSDVRTTVVSITAANDPPVNTVPGAQTVNEDTVLAIGGVSVADVDSNLLTTTLTVASGTLHVTVSTGVNNNDTGTITVAGTLADINAALTGLSYTGNLNFNGLDALTVTTDDGTAQDIDTVAITVNPANDAPVAQDGSASGNEDSPINGTLVATDVDSPSLTYGLAAQAAHGAVVVNPNGSYSYTPNTDFNGADSFTFTASDGTATSNAATISLTLNPVNDTPVAQDGSASGNEDSPINSTLVATDVDSPSLSYSLGVQAAHGTAVVNLNGSYAYTPNQDFNGADSFTFTANDGTATSNAATISLTVNPVNDAPVNTVPGAQSVNEDTVLAIGGLSVADVDSPTLTTTLTVANGLLTVVPKNGVTITSNLANALTISGSVADVNAALAGVNYIGNPGFNGADTLTIVTSDGALTDTDTAAITVNPVNDAPILDLDADNSSGAPGRNFVTTFTENGSAIALADTDIVLTDDDPDLQSVRFFLVNAQAGDSLGVNGNLPAGITATITANELTLTGTVPVTDYQTALQQIAFSNSSDAPDTSDRLILVTVEDGVATSDAFALVHVLAVNDPPVAQDGSANGNEDTPINGTLVATDVDSPSLSYSLGVQAAHGTAVVNLNGSYAYTPNTDFNGADSFTFTASDGTATSNAATISLTVNPVNDAPVLDLDANNSSGAAGADYTAIFTDSGAAVPIADADALIADVDSANLISATITLTNAQATDLLSVNGTLPTGITGAFDPGTGILTLSGSAPLAAYQAALRQIEYDSSVPIPLTATRIIEVVANDGVTGSDPAFSLIQIALAGPPGLDLDADDSASSGSDYATTFTEDGAAITIADTDIAISAPALVSATITLTNPLPGDLLSVNGTLAGGVTAAYDPSTGVMTLTGTAPAAAYQAASDQIVYSNSGDNPSTDDRIITVVVNDGINDSNTATAIVHVVAVNDPPVAQDGSASGNEDTPINGTLVATDVDSPSLTYSLGIQAAHGTAVVNSDGSYTYTPNIDFNGADSFTFTANDGTTDSNTATINLTVDLSPTNITLSNPSVAEFSANGAVVGALITTDPHPGESFTYTLLDSAGGLFAVSGSNLVVAGLLDFEQHTSHSVTVRATDSGGLTFDQVLVVNIINVDPEVGSGTPGADLIVGGPLDDHINTGEGNDTLFTGGGDDIGIGAGGDDVLATGADNDFAYGGVGNDYAYLGDGNDVALGDAGSDVLLGEAGNDALYGGDDQDYLFGGAGANILFGGAGVDVLNSEGANDAMYGGAGGDFFNVSGTGPAAGFGDDGNDVYVGGAGIDTFTGGDGQDYFYGRGGNDVAYGGLGSDVLQGEAGSDFLVGGGDTDYLFGGAGADVFVVQTIAGTTLIQDFTRPEDDLISLQGSGLSTFEQVLAATSDFGSFCAVTINASTNVWIIGQTSATLQAGDFAFS